MHRARYCLFLIGYVAALATICSCQRPGQYRETSGAIWATTYHIVYKSPVSLDDSIIKVFESVDKSLSPFNPASRMSEINRGASNMTDSLFRKVFTTSREVNLVSGGLFDPTVAPLVNLWGFGYRNAGHTPDSSEIASALSLVGIDRCSITCDTLCRPDNRMEFNFSAITKGYACDLVGDMLSRHGCSDFMVEIGGEITVAGMNPYGEPWHIMIDAPIESDTSVVHSRLAIVAITDCGMATSGNYRNFHSTDSGSIGHTINPRTGYPALRSTTLSATVIAPETILADALATACMVMQPDSAIRMIESMEGTSVLLVTEGQDKEWMIRTSSHFPSIKASTPQANK